MEYNYALQYNRDDELSIVELARYLYKDKGWVVEYANSEGEFGKGDHATGEERFTWEDDPDEAVTHAQLDARRAELAPIIESGRLRYLRDQKLAETDWWAVGDRTMTDEQRTYRQALRDLPSNTTDPRNPTWPTKPS